jgi:hypothetical protein
MQALTDSSLTREGNAKRKPRVLVPLKLESPHFIPVSRSCLQDRLVAFLAKNEAERKEWQSTFDCMAAWRHEHYRERLLELIEDYEPFSPDTDTAVLTPLNPEESAKAHAKFLDNVRVLLRQANYTELNEADLRQLLAERSPYGLRLRVDLSDFDDALIFYRGVKVEDREERNPWHLYLTRDRYQVPLFERLFLLLKIKPTEKRIAEIMRETGASEAKAKRILSKRQAHFPPGVSSDYIYVKIFKRIPQIDLEMLFPNTRVAFHPFDKLKLALTAGGGTAAGVAGTATKLLAATNPFTLAAGLAGLCAVVFRQVMKFFNTRNRYMMMLAQNLYFCSLANNRGALTLLADRAEEEDIKEEMLLYAFLACEPDKYKTLALVEDQAENFLLEHCGVKVGFDAEDALDRVCSTALLKLETGDRYKAIPPAEVRDILAKLWTTIVTPDGVIHNLNVPAEAN